MQTHSSSGRKGCSGSGFRVTQLAAACTLAIAGTHGARAQQAPDAAAAPAPAASAASAPSLTTVTVTGIRGSLEGSMDLRRDSQGIVDGIVAEDIGKFPDNNLAESLQRISGVSIDRPNGEGSRVTVRGLGPDFNLVLLNGRQMPAATIEATGPSNSRAFNFANLASESIAALEVFKTSRAAQPTGGIGATINIKTARPLDNPGLHATFGLKAQYDESNQRLPDSIQGSAVTPEVSGIYSNTFADGMFGVAISGSYQARNSGYNQASVPNGWRPFTGSENNWGTIPQPGTPGSERIVNRPGPTDVYSVPQNLMYSVNGIQRQRTNGQIALQYAPIKELVATLDYTYSENKIQTQRNELSAWFNFGPSSSSWTNGPVAAPIYYSEAIVPATSDIAMAGANYATKATNKSTGFNLAWKASPELGLALDMHSSTATAGADSPYGSSSALGTASFNRGTTTGNFSQKFPVLSIDGSTIDASKMLVTGSSFRNSLMDAKVEQIQLNGNYNFVDASRLDFGVSSTKVNNQTAFSNVQRDSWGGATNAADYADSDWKADTIRHYFSKISGSDSPALFNQFFTWDFNAVRNQAVAALARSTCIKPGVPVPDPACVAAAMPAANAQYQASNVFTTDRTVEEKSQGAFLQYSTGWDALGVPMNLALGVRYENTDVNSTALVPIGTGISWNSNNEYSVLFGAPGYTSLNGSYSNWLPSIDFEVEVTRDQKFRLSYSHTIGRPGWGDIQGGQTLNSQARVDGGTGAQGNPGLLPLLSKNIDVAYEWYYAKGSYVALGYFHKSIDNYIGTSTVNATPFNLHTPANGLFWNQAISKGGCPKSDNTCIRNYIFDNFNGQAGVTKGPNDSNGNRTGTIEGQPGDPIANFIIATPANQKSATLQGVEFAGQHMFGNSGFGVAYNYTYVNSGLTYDNYSLGEQFALEGLSNTANLVGFYQDAQWQIRAAYNWRDRFLTARFDGSGLPNPVYTAPYGQLDLNISYQFDANLSAQFQVLNVLDATTRLYGRNENQTLFATQTGPQYLLGIRYTF